MEHRLYIFWCSVSSLLVDVALFGGSNFPHYQYILKFHAKSLTLHYSGSYLANIILTAMHPHHTELFIIIIITLFYFGKIIQK